MGWEVSRNSVKCCNAVSMEKKCLRSKELLQLLSKVMLKWQISALFFYSHF